MKGRIEGQAFGCSENLGSKCVLDGMGWEVCLVYRNEDAKYLKQKIRCLSLWPATYLENKL